MNEERRSLVKSYSIHDCAVFNRELACVKNNVVCRATSGNKKDTTVFDCNIKSRSAAGNIDGASISYDSFNDVSTIGNI